VNFQIELAKPDDDAAIRRLLATNAVPGRVTVTFEREPNYFAGCATMGLTCQSLVARAGDRIAGVACRATRPMFVNGREVRLGYLGQLRVDERFRGRWLVSRGFRFLKRLHDDDPVPAYLLSLIEENREALGVLIELRRPGFPIFRRFGRLYTLALALGPPRRTKVERSTQCEIERAGRDDLADIVAFLRRSGAARQFYPAYSEDDFRGEVTLGFRPEDFFVARRNGALAGVIGLWDQSSYKQTIARGYAGWLRWARPAYNIAARLSARAPIPNAGEKILHAYASFVCVAGEDPEVFRALLRRVCAVAAERGYSYLMAGFDERDPLLEVARAHPHIAYRSRVFIAGWPKDPDNQPNQFERFYEQLDDRIPYFEIAAL
jgi:ribosomal protein S18 acetylase RimI-like enzyme